VISDILPFIREYYKSLPKEPWKEWTDAYNNENIPKTRLFNTYHVEMGIANGGQNNQDHLTVTVPVTIRMYIPPARNVVLSREKAIAIGDQFINGILAPKVRLTQQPGILNIKHNTTDTEQLNDSNDNGVILKMGFSFIVIYSTR